MKGICQTLTDLQAAGKTALIPFLTAGDPDLETSAQLLHAYAAAGADLIEVGVPFSDPMADGPTLQQAADRALAAGGSLSQTLALIARVRREGLQTPLVVFSYLNPIYRMGFDNFARQAAEAGASGVLIVDLPPEHASAYLPLLAAQGLETIFLASPTTPTERLPLIEASSTGAVYYVARLGVTGARTELESSLVSELQQLQSQLSQPVIVGFGISKPEHVAALAGQVAGVVVASALVAELATADGPEAACQKATAFVQALKQPLLA